MGIIDLLKDIPLSAVLREKIVGLESENAALRSENESLKVQLSQSEEKRRALENQIAQKISHDNSIDEVKERMLILLAHGNLSEEEVASSAGVSVALAEFHLNELVESGHITHHIGFITIGDDGPIRPWYIDQTGRKYLVSRGLLN